MINNTFSYQMHDQTERPQQYFSQDTHNIIKHRYMLALSLSSGKRVLEVGSGHGIAMHDLSQQAEWYVAGEYSDENIRLMQKKKNNEVPIIQFDAHNLPFLPHSFDIVITLAMIYYLDFEKFLKEVKSVLKPGGTLFFCTSNKDVPGFVAAPYTTKYYTIPELNQLLIKNGFECQFQGAFSAIGGSYFQRKMKACIKTIGKFFITGFPGGSLLWQCLRAKHVGETIPLPDSVSDIIAEKQVMFQLESNKRNHHYRVIYGIAKTSA